MGLQLFSKRKWEDDSFNETNCSSVLRNAKEKADERKNIFKKNVNLLSIMENAKREYHKIFGRG